MTPPPPSAFACFGLRHLPWAGLLMAGLLAFAFATGFHYIAKVWAVDTFGLNPFGRLPVWDFLNLHTGGALARAGEFATLFDPEPYRLHLRGLYSNALGNHEWSYPPTMLLVGAPLSLLPLAEAYVLYSALGIALLGLMLYLQGYRGAFLVLVLFSPAIFINQVFGQNGAYSALLLIGALLLVRTRPILAGILIGLLTLKPHLGLLLPFCLIAGKHWRCFLSAGVTALVLAAASVVCFGTEPWSLFIAHTLPTMTTILEAPYPQSYHMNSISFFTLARALGADLALAYGVQKLVVFVGVALGWRLWRDTRLTDAHRAAITLLLILTCTPYGYNYDMVALGFATLAIATCPARRGTRILCIVVWCLPILVNPLGWAGLPIAPLLLVMLTCMAWHDSRLLP